MSDYAKTNFWCHIVIDGLKTNQIALLLHVRGRTDFDKMFGIDCRRFLFAPPPPPSRSPPPTSPQVFAPPRGAPLLARFFARLFDLRLEKERNRLLHRLRRLWNVILQTYVLIQKCLWMLKIFMFFFLAVEFGTHHLSGKYFSAISKVRRWKTFRTYFQSFRMYNFSALFLV